MSIDNVNITSDDEMSLAMSRSPETQFRPLKLKTIPVLSFHLVISTGISFLGILLAIAWPDSKRCEAYFLMLYLRGAFWLLTIILGHIVQHYHEKLWLFGYIYFHKSTKMHRNIPFYIVTLWNNVILIIQALMHHYYGEHFAEHCVKGFVSPLFYITLFNITETLFLYLIIGSHIAHIYKFNKTAPPPDDLDVSFFQGDYTSNEQSYLRALLEKQVDIINYLKDHIENLNHRLIHLNSEIKIIRGETE